MAAKKAAAKKKTPAKKAAAEKKTPAKNKSKTTVVVDVPGTTDEWSATFTLDTERDASLIEFLDTSKDRNKQIVNLLNLGRSVQLAATFSTSDDSLRELLKPLDDRIDSITNTMLEFQGKTKNAAVIGTQGEKIAKNQFDERFNALGDVFDINSSAGHQADIHAKMKVTMDSGKMEMVPILIEAKEYANGIGTVEIDKFWADMEERPENYGMFISFKQSIATKKSDIDIEVRGTNVVFFISNDTHGDHRHLVAWEMLRMIIKTDFETGMIGKGVSYQVETLMENLSREILQLSNAKSNLGAIKRTAETMMKQAGENSGKLFQASSEIKSTIDHSIRRMRTLISNTGEEYARAAEQLLVWKNNVMDDAFENFTPEQKVLITALEEPLQKYRENLRFEKDENKKKVTVQSSVFPKRNVVFESKSKSLVIHFDYPLNVELPQKLGGEMEGGKYKITLTTVQKHFAKIPWFHIRDALNLLFEDPVSAVDEAPEESVDEVETENKKGSTEINTSAANQSESVESTEVNYESMKIPELRELLKAAGKTVGGKKDDLIARLKE
jgi:ElaB/YqjD/DUF883 family membrane-anchored ribosome-binding protein